MLNKIIRSIEDYLSMDADDGNDWDGVENEKAELKSIIEEVMKKFKPEQRSSSREKKAKVNLQQASLFDDISF